MNRNKVEWLNRLFERRTAAEEKKNFFEHEQIRQIFNDVESDIVKAIKNLAFDDAEGRDALFRELRVMEQVRRRINVAVSELEIIKHNINEVQNGN